MNKPQAKGSQLWLVVALIVTVVLWATAFAVIKSAGTEYGAGELALLRFVTAGVTLSIGALFQGTRLPRGRHIAWFFVSGLLCVALYHPLLNYGEQVVSAGTAALLINTAPVWVAIFAIFLLGEKLSWRKSLGIATGFVGIVLLVIGRSGTLSLQPESLLIVLAAMCAALYVITQKKYLADFGALDFTLWTVWAGVLLLLPWFGWATVQRVQHASFHATLEVVYLGIFPAAIAYMTFAYVTIRMSAATALSIMYLVPAMAMVMAWPYLGEVPTLLGLTGGALAIAGVIIVNSAKKNNTAK